MEKIYKPTISGLAAMGRPFKGVIYVGLMLTNEGPKVIEYNARFGDPEAQVVLARLKTPLYDVCQAIIDERLNEIHIEWDDNAAAVVVLASGGYPGSYQTGYKIEGLETVGCEVFHAGTKAENGVFYTSGGRVLGVTAVAPTLNQALDKAYADVSKINFTDRHFRADIGKV